MGFEGDLMGFSGVEWDLMIIEWDLRVIWCDLFGENKNGSGPKNMIEQTETGIYMKLSNE